MTLNVSEIYAILSMVFQLNQKIMSMNERQYTRVSPEKIHLTAYVSPSMKTLNKLRPTPKKCYKINRIKIT